jgi:hypothetical protein
LLLSFTSAVNVAVPLALGTPEIVPVEELSASPAGRLPEAIDHLYTGAPPVAWRVSVKNVPAVAVADAMAVSLS